MTAVTMSARDGAFILSEAPGTLSREMIVVKSGSNLEAGTVLGKVAAGAATASAISGTGNATISAVVVGDGVKPGAHKLMAIAATVMQLFDPQGNMLGEVNTGVEATLGGLTFTVTAGVTPMVAGDEFTITVAAGSGMYVAYAEDGTNGSDIAAGILLSGVDATDENTDGVALVRLAEVASDMLIGLDAAAIVDLAALNIVVRS